METRKAGQEQVRRLLDISRRIVSELDFEGVLEHVVEAARELTGARYAALGVLDADKRGFERFVFVGIDEATRRRIGPLPRGHGILGELIRDPRPLRLARINEHPRSYGFPAAHPEMTTFAGVPVTIRGEVYGNLYLTEKAGGEPFTEADEELLVGLADWAAIAIDNARSHSALEQRRAELERAVQGLEATVALDRELGGETEIERVLELIAKRGRALIDARASLVLLVDRDTIVVAEVAGDVSGELVGRTLGDAGAVVDVLRAGVPQRVRGTALAPFRELGIAAESGVLAPLRFRDQPIGVLACLDAIEGETGFGAGADLLLGSFSINAAAAVAATRELERELRRMLISASVRERERWARELHDETLQELGALKVLQESALAIDRVETMRHALLQAGDQVERVIGEIQGLITDLRPASLGELGVAAALEALIGRFRERSSVEIDAEIGIGSGEGAPARYPREVETTVYRVVQEALNNAAKHAHASKVRVAVLSRDGMLMLSVEDDGVGFDPADEHGGFGLLGMRERVELAGGELGIETRPEGGTRVTAVLPESP